MGPLKWRLKASGYYLLGSPFLTGQLSRWLVACKGSPQSGQRAGGRVSRISRAHTHLTLHRAHLACLATGITSLISVPTLKWAPVRYFVLRVLNHPVAPVVILLTMVRFRVIRVILPEVGLNLLNHSGYVSVPAYLLSPSGRKGARVVYVPAPGAVIYVHSHCYHGHLLSPQKAGAVHPSPHGQPFVHPWQPFYAPPPQWWQALQNTAG